MELFHVSVLRILIVTIAVVSVALGLAFMALVFTWLVGSFNVDRLIAVVGACTGVIGLLVTTLVPLGKWLLR